MPLKAIFIVESRSILVGEENRAPSVDRDDGADVKARKPQKEFG